jgi:hypothetical protein
MSFEDPNREAVGLAPIWTGADTDPPPEGDDDEEDVFDPGAHTVAEVEAYVDDNPDEVDAVLAAEKAGKNRVTLVEALEDR